jgi:hypothetical protein
VLRQTIGAVVVRFGKKIEGNLCEPCIDRYFRTFTLTTFLLGWWGVISFFVTPFVLILNFVEYFGGRGPATADARSVPAGTPRVSALRSVLLVVSIPLMVLLVAFVAVAGLAMGVAYLLSSSPGQPRPGADEFRAANERLFAFSGQAAFGNSSEAELLAKRYGGCMEGVRAVAFTGGREKDAPSLTQGHFVTHCELHKGRACFLVHVPELRQYAPSAKEGLSRFAWACARRALADRARTESLQVGVGVRGILLYDAAMIGSISDERPVQQSDSESDLYPFFSVEATQPSAPPTASRGAPEAPVPGTPGEASQATPERLPEVSRAERLRRSIADLHSPEYETRAAAEKELLSLGPHAESALVRLAQDRADTASGRCAALHLLAKLGGAEAARTLLHSLEATESGVAGCASEGIGGIQGQDALILSRLTDGIQGRCIDPAMTFDPRASYCAHALEALGRLGVRAAGAAPLVVRVLDRQPEYSYTRAPAIVAAGRLAPATKACVPVLTLALSDDNTYIQQEAARALGAMGAEARPALPALRRLEQTRRVGTATEAIARIEGKAPPTTGWRVGR